MIATKFSLIHLLMGIALILSFLKKNTAIFIVEVKDYNLVNYSVDAFNKWQVSSEKGVSKISSPQSQAFRYKSNLYNLHLPVLGLSYLKNRNFF